MKTNTKTAKIEVVLTVVDAGHRCHGTMPWESPFLRMHGPGINLLWHSDSVEAILRKRFGISRMNSLVGKQIAVKAIVRPDKYNPNDGIDRTRVVKMNGFVLA